MCVMYKHIALLVRQDGVSHEAFVNHWHNTHTPIARGIDGVVRYQQVLPTDPAHAEFDGVAELYFEDPNKLHRALGSEGSRDYDAPGGRAKEAREDVDNFLAIEKRHRRGGSPERRGRGRHRRSVQTLGVPGPTERDVT